MGGSPSRPGDGHRQLAAALHSSRNRPPAHSTGQSPLPDVLGYNRGPEDLPAAHCIPLRPSHPCKVLSIASAPPPGLK